jgi:hypothetical protein
MAAVNLPLTQWQSTAPSLFYKNRKQFSQTPNPNAFGQAEYTDQITEGDEKTDKEDDDIMGAGKLNIHDFIVWNEALKLELQHKKGVAGVPLYYISWGGGSASMTFNLSNLILSSYLNCCNLHGQPGMIFMRMVGSVGITVWIMFSECFHNFMASVNHAQRVLMETGWGKFTSPVMKFFVRICWNRVAEMTCKMTKAVELKAQAQMKMGHLQTLDESDQTIDEGGKMVVQKTMMTERKNIMAKRSPKSCLMSS